MRMLVMVWHYRYHTFSSGVLSLQFSIVNPISCSIHSVYYDLYALFVWKILEEGMLTKFSFVVVVF
jgi:hypothetical protein